jgi:hypothetical protein
MKNSIEPIWWKRLRFFHPTNSVPSGLTNCSAFHPAVETAGYITISLREILSTKDQT